MSEKRITQPLAEYMLGVLMVMQRSSGGNTGYFLGEVSSSGWWYYFPILFIFKEPLPSLILILLAFLLPIILNPAGYNMFASTRAAFLYISASIILALILIESLKKGQFKIIRSPLDLIITIFAVTIIASTLNSVHLRTSIFGQIWRYEGLLAWLSYFVIFFAVIYAIKNRQQQIRLLYGVISSACIISIYGIFQHFGFDFISWASDQDLTRITSTLGGPTYLGAYLVLILPLTLMLASTKESPSHLRIISIISAILMIIALLFTFARGAWLALLVSLVFLFLINFTTVMRSKLAISLIVGILLASSLLFATGQLSPYTERAKSAFNLAKWGSGGIRLVAWQQTVEMIKDRPLLGWGPETYSLIFPRYITMEWEQTVRRDFPTDKAHNDLLQIASTMGLASLVPYILIFILFFWNSLRSIKYISDPFQKNLLKGLFAGVLAYLVQLQFNFSVIDITPIFWIFIGLAISISSVALNKTERVISLPFKLTSPDSLKYAYAVLLLIIFGISILSIRPIIADTYFRQGLEALQSGNPETSVAKLSGARDFDSKEIYYSQESGKVYIKLLNATKDKTYFSKAIETFDEAQRINPLNEYTYLYLGDAYLAGAEILKEPDLLKLAATNYKKVLVNDPYFAQAHLSLGIAYAQMKMTKKAIEEWKTVPNLYPDSDSAYYNLGTAYEQMGKTAEALKSYKKVLEINSSNQLAKEGVNRLQN
jgi:O-antigen ligase/TolA-binding protein